MNSFTLERVARATKKFVRKAIGCSCLEDYSVEKRRMMWSMVKPLEKRHIHNCKLLEDRLKMLEYMPKNAVCAEIGILRCEFSESILEITQPSKLHLIDIDPNAINIAKEKFKDKIASGQVEVHLGDSAATLMAMSDNYFDWTYVDGDHSYLGAKRDLEASRLKLKTDGLIAVNDYVYFSVSDFKKYGVLEAVNDFCINHSFEMLFLAFQGRSYNDVVLRKITSEIAI
ncbi:class I SAM-dependent methyltransferase [Leptolyngbyaceae cyanobacterium UHCC 1019]